MEEQLIIQTDGFELSQVDFLLRLVVATGVGFVIGIEREHHSMEKEREFFAGVRTFIFIVLLGFLSSLLSMVLSPWVFVITLAGFISIVAVAYWGKRQKGNVGGTTIVAMIISFLLGGVVLLGYIEVALPIMVLIVLALSLKVRLHNLIGRLTREELLAFISFVSIAALLIPFLPDTNTGPYEAINPYEIGWVVILVSGLSFLAYILVKFLGTDRGIVLSGILGGVVSSTAVAWIFSHKSQKTPGIAVSSAIAILAASTLMVPRVFVWVYIFDRSLVTPLLLPLAILFAGGIIVSYIFYRQFRPDDKNEAELQLDNPLSLRGAILFAILYMGILLLVEFANDKLGSSGTYLTSVVAALPNIDAITISMAKLGGASIARQVALNAILLATLSNTIVKVAISLWFGSKSMRKYILIGFGVIFACGLLGFVVLNL